MEFFALLRAEWGESRRLSRVQRVITGVLSVVAFFLLYGLFQELKPVGPLFFSLSFIPVTLSTLATFGGPIKRILWMCFGSIAGAVVVIML